MNRLLLLILFTFPFPSLAEMYGAEYETCSRSTTVGIVQCVDQAGEKWDRRLNESYKALMKRSESDQNAALKKAQRLWIAYRDANCSFYAANGGSIGQIDAFECIRAMTKARTCEIDSVNRGDSEPSVDCSTNGGTKKADSTALPSTDGATVPIANTKALGSPTGMKSPLEGLKHQSNVSFLTMHSKSKYNRDKPHGNVYANVHFEAEVTTAGGSAVFGWMEDSNLVVLMTHAKYLPSLTLAATTRRIEFAKPLDRVAQAPRYLMTCVWQREDDQVSPSLHVYAERDDANSSAKNETNSQSVLVQWAAVPASRAQKRFAAHDYCGEVSTADKTSAPPWEDTLKRKE